MVLVVPNVARFAVNQTYEGNDVVNVLDVAINELAMSRAEACDSVAQNIIDVWTTTILTRQSPNLSAVSVSWVDLNSEDGSTGERAGGYIETWPEVGTGEAAALPGNVCVLVTKECIHARNQRPGRMYICGAGESETTTTSVNELSAGGVTAWQIVMNDFFTGMTLSDINYEAHLSVVHTLRDAEGDIISASSNAVTAFTVNALLATQRRRLRG